LQVAKSCTNDLANLTPADFIAKYGTHYVTEVVVGGKASCTCVADELTQTKTEDLKVSAEVSYVGVTGSTSIDVSSSSKTITWTSTTAVTALGGTSSGQTIQNKDDFAKWSASIPEGPAVIDFVLAPITNLDAKLTSAWTDAMNLIRPGYYIIGGYVEYNNINSTDAWSRTYTWGNTITNNNSFPTVIGYVKGWSPTYGWGNSKIVLVFRKEFQSGHTFTITGGYLQHNNESSKAAWKKEDWNYNSGVTSDREQLLTDSASAWTSDYSWGNCTSTIQLNGSISKVNPIIRGITGGKQIVNNLESTVAWTDQYTWGMQTTTQITVLTAQAFNQRLNSWGNSSIILYLTDDVGVDD